MLSMVAITDGLPCMVCPVGVCVQITADYDNFVVGTSQCVQSWVVHFCHVCRVLRGRERLPSRCQVPTQNDKRSQKQRSVPEGLYHNGLCERSVCIGCGLPRLLSTGPHCLPAELTYTVICRVPCPHCALHCSMSCDGRLARRSLKCCTPPNVA